MTGKLPKQAYYLAIPQHCCGALFTLETRRSIKYSIINQLINQYISQSISGFRRPLPQMASRRNSVSFHIPSFAQSIIQSVNQYIIHSINRWQAEGTVVLYPIVCSVNQLFTQSISQSIDESINESINQISRRHVPPMANPKSERAVVLYPVICSINQLINQSFT